MIHSRPDFVYFDLGNVLLFFDHDIACEKLSQLFKQSPERIKGLVFESDLQKQYEDGRISTKEFYDALCREFDVNPTLEDVCYAASAIFYPNYQIIPLVAQLHQTGFPLGILSNTCDAHWEYIYEGRYRFINDLFGVHALSFELKSSKPDAEIYVRAAKLAGVDPSRIFFVDDKPENVAGAVDCGMDAVLFEGHLKLTRDLQDRGLVPSL